MTATADGGSGAGERVAGGDDAAYFRAIEDVFVRLRGAPLLLSPADFQVASRWRQAGVPLALVEATLEEVFTRRRERGAKSRINSLRYCAPAVESAWAEVLDLQGPRRRDTSAEPVVDAAARVHALADEVDRELPDGSPLRQRAAARLEEVAARARASAPEVVEEALRAV